MITRSVVKTDFGDAYLKRLCRHFAHKIPATINGSRGTLEFPFGLCVIDVDATSMQIEIDVDSADNADRAESVLADHLIRMANRDTPVVNWERAP
ncbi:MAG: DUF2218 domain-containing protein [Pseudomonadota bacterium]